MFPAPFSQIATTQFQRGYQDNFTLAYLWPCIIAMAIFVTVPCAVGDEGADGCPAGCSCSIQEGFVSSLEVQCSDIGLSDIPAMLNSSTVDTLDLSNNEISTLKNATFFNYSRLSSLILSYSKVKKIEINAFAGLQMMREIDLSYNKLQEFDPNIFSSNPVLETVSLRGNSLVYLSSDFPILISNSISFLDLSSCSVTTIPPITFSGLPKLYSLNLSCNNLQTISLCTLENIPELRILELNNNRWKCKCEILEVLQWTASKRGQQPAHKPVDCLDGKRYRSLWTVAGGNRSCSESKTTESVAASDPQFTIEDAESRPSSWNISTLIIIFVILPITLGAAVFLSLIAVNWLVKRDTCLRTQHDTQETDNHNAGFFSRAPLLNPQLTSDHTKKKAGGVNSCNYGVSNAELHVYEEIH